MTATYAGVGLGTFPFAGPFTPVTGESARGILRRFVAGGGGYLDTSPTYAHGSVEALVGEVLREFPREDLQIATSCGYVRQDDGGYKVSGARADVEADCEDSLRRLGLGYIDVYFSHIPDLSVSFAETVDAMCSLQRRGLIRALGVSNVTLEQLKSYNASGAIRYVQNRFSPINRTLGDDFVTYCRDHDIAIVAYQVLERGLLTNGGARGLRLREGDLRHTKPEFAQTVSERLGLWLRTSICPLAAQHNVSVAALAIWWATHLPGVQICQCGATSVAQVEDILAARSFQPRGELLAILEVAYQELERQIRGTTGGTIRGFMGLESYNVYKGSASGEMRR